ncbi:Beta-phosphoglucomutase [Paenibacillus sp. P1XP2]|nr:Beta-phosphoglucomutase [Paenibacillus sp. P1XP2]
MDYITRMDESEILPGALDFLKELKAGGMLVALGSASKNAMTILNNTKLAPYFDAIVDGTKTVSAKPDPEVFLLGAQELGVDPAACVVFEDAEAGIEAAIRAGMRSIGVGSPATLGRAGAVVSSLREMSLRRLEKIFSSR